MVTSAAAHNQNIIMDEINNLVSKMEDAWDERCSRHDNFKRMAQMARLAFPGSYDGNLKRQEAIISVGGSKLVQAGGVVNLNGIKPGYYVCSWDDERGHLRLDHVPYRALKTLRPDIDLTKA